MILRFFWQYVCRNDSQVLNVSFARFCHPSSSMVRASHYGSECCGFDSRVGPNAGAFPSTFPDTFRLNATPKIRQAFQNATPKDLLIGTTWPFLESPRDMLRPKSVILQAPKRIFGDFCICNFKYFLDYTPPAVRFSNPRLRSSA